jgi:hypothetical protein
MALPVGIRLPDLSGATHWLNGAVTNERLAGNAVLVHFWAVSCPICKDNIPVLRGIVGKQWPFGLVCLSIHMPRCEADANLELVTEVANALQVPGYCAADNQHILGDRFQTEGKWPSYFLFDARSILKRRAAGGLGLNLIELALEQLATSLGSPESGTGNLLAESS